MARNGRPPSLKSLEMNRLRSNWQKAREGEQEAKDALLKALGAHKSVDAFVRFWIAMKALPDPKKPKPMQNVVGLDEEPNVRSPSTPWERARSTLTTERARVVGGGLPSLGKRAK